MGDTPLFILFIGQFSGFFFFFVGQKVFKPKFEIKTFKLLFDCDKKIESLMYNYIKFY